MFCLMHMYSSSDKILRCSVMCSPRKLASLLMFWFLCTLE